MRHLGLGVGHKRDEHDGEPMEVDPLDLGVHNAPHPDEGADYDSEPEGNTAFQDEEEEQEGDDSEEEEQEGDDSEEEDDLEEDLGYDEL